jgi:DNA-binding GntR family transcriptional regulator
VSPFEPLADKSLADRAYEILRDAILKMTLKPGETLVEAKLANALGISKTPIRQALHRLEQTGLVTGVPNKGYTVSHLTLRDAYEILDIRAALAQVGVVSGRQRCRKLANCGLDRPFGVDALALDVFGDALDKLGGVQETQMGI